MSSIEPISLDSASMPSPSTSTSPPTNIIQEYTYGFAPELSDFILYVPYIKKESKTEREDKTDLIPSKLSAKSSSSSSSSSLSSHPTLASTSTITTIPDQPTSSSPKSTSPSSSPSETSPLLTCTSPPYIAHHIHKQVLASSCHLFTTLFTHDSSTHDMILPNMTPHASHQHVMFFLQAIYQQPATAKNKNQECHTQSPPSLVRRHSAHIKDETNQKRMQQEMSDAKALAYLAHYFHNDTIATAAETRLLACLPSLDYSIYSNDVAHVLHLLLFAQSYHMDRLMDECIARLVHDNSLHYIVAPGIDDKLNIFSPAYKFREKKATHMMSLPQLEHLNQSTLLKLVCAMTKERMRERRT